MNSEGGKSKNGDLMKQQSSMKPGKLTPGVA